LALFPKERLEVHRPLGRLDLAKQRVEVRAIFVHVDGGAFGGAVQRKFSEGVNEVLDEPVEIDTQLGIAMPLDRPDHDPEKDDDAEPDRKCHAAIIGPNLRRKVSDPVSASADKPKAIRVLTVNAHQGFGALRRSSALSRMRDALRVAAD